MKTDVINGFPFYHFGESEVEEARAFRAEEGLDRYHVLIDTTCFCGDPIESTIESFESGSVMHSDAYHDSLPVE